MSREKDLEKALQDLIPLAKRSYPCHPGECIDEPNGRNCELDVGGCLRVKNAKKLLLPKLPTKQPGLVNEELYAFWGYDTYPYILGAKVVRSNANGHYQCEGFGTGYWFKARVVLKGAEGRRALAALRKLEKDHLVATQDFNGKWQTEATLRLPELVPLLK